MAADGVVKRSPSLESPGLSEKMRCAQLLAQEHMPLKVQSEQVESGKRPQCPEGGIPEASRRRCLERQDFTRLGSGLRPGLEVRAGQA